MFRNMKHKDKRQKRKFSAANVDWLIFDVQEYADPDPLAGPQGCHKPRTLREFQMSKACRFLPIIF
jgi:hypothetical protein